MRLRLRVRIEGRSHTVRSDVASDASLLSLARIFLSNAELPLPARMRQISEGDAAQCLSLNGVSSLGLCVNKRNIPNSLSLSLFSPLLSLSLLFPPFESICTHTHIYTIHTHIISFFSFFFLPFPPLFPPTPLSLLSILVCAANSIPLFPPSSS